MSDKSSSSSSSGIGFTGLLAVAFIVLKLCNVIDWSWWWVLSPIWGSVALVIFVVIPIVIYIAYRDAKKEKEYERKREAERLANPGRQSKFMQRLDEAMKASEERRNQN